jgi:hypothetical protein
MTRKAPAMESRRNFLKASAASAAGLVIAGAHRTAFAQSWSPWPATGYMQINPNIDNCRVAFIKDASMLLTTGAYDFSNFNNSGIDYTKAKANIDKMACALAKKNTIAEAWARIFRKPDAKAWNQVIVAMKVNAVGGYSPCVPAVARLCEALNGLGVPYSNITVFDAGDATGNGCVDKYGPFKTSGKLPAVNIAARGSASTININGETWPCQDYILNADILITCAVDKGHDQKDKFSGLTMSLKNHTGSIKYSCATSLTQLINYHKSSAILGTPSASVPARQQLAFVDSTWAGAPGSWGGAVDNGAVLSTFVMGTFPGAVDYLTAVKVRNQLYPINSDGTVNRTLVNRFMTDFGYTDAERTALETMDPNSDSLGRGFADATQVVFATSRSDVDAKITSNKAGKSTVADVRGVIKNYRNGI